MVIREQASGPDRATLEALRQDSQVIHHRRERPIKKWTFRPRIRVKRGTEISEIAERHHRRTSEAE